MTYTDEQLTQTGATYHRADGQVRRLGYRVRVGGGPWRAGWYGPAWHECLISTWLRWCRSRGGIVKIEVSDD